MINLINILIADKIMINIILNFKISIEQKYIKFETGRYLERNEK